MVLLPKAVDDPTLSRLSPGKAGSPVSVLAHSFRSPSAPRGAIVYNQVLKGRPTPPRAARPTSSSPRLAHPSPQRQTTTTYIQAASGLGWPAVAYESPTTLSASPRPMAGAYASPERRPASPRHESRPASPRHESPLSSAFHTPRGELAERPLSPRTLVSRLEHENDKLRTTVARLKMNVIYMAGSSDQLDTRAAAVASRSPQLRSKSPRLTDGMSHEQMMYEATLRNQHNKQRQQLRGILKQTALAEGGKGNELVELPALELAAKLAKLDLPDGVVQSARRSVPGHVPGGPATLSRPSSSRARGEGGAMGGFGLGGGGGGGSPVMVPYKGIVAQLSYPTPGTEEVRLEATRRAAQRRSKKAVFTEKVSEHAQKVVEKAEEVGITEAELRSSHEKIRNHFATRFKEVRRGFRLLDEDSSGTLTHNELRSVLTMFNLAIKPHVLQKIIELADWNGDGAIDYAEFARIMTADDIVWLKDTLVADATAVGKKEARTHTTGLTRKAYRDGAAQLRPGVSRADVRDAQVRLRYELEEKYARITDCFKYIDADRTGKLERHEVKRLLVEFNIVGVSDGAIESLIDFADTDGDGEINYREFARVLTSDDLFTGAHGL